MAVRVLEFSSRGYKIRKILHKNQHTQRKLLNFEFWINGELSKIGHHFSNKVIYELILSKNVLLNWYSSMKKKVEKDSDKFDIEN